MTGLSVIDDEALRAALGAARIAIDLDEAVGEIDRRVVAHPVGAELQPVLAARRSDRSGSARAITCACAGSATPRAFSRYAIAFLQVRRRRGRAGSCRPACRRDRPPRESRRQAL